MADKSVIVNIEARVRQLMGEHRDAVRLNPERDALKAENRALKERIRALDAELARAQLAEGLAGGDGGREKARARVNRLMREVDKCIALLRQPETGAEERQATK